MSGTGCSARSGEANDDGPHLHRWRFGLDKWYLDAILPDGGLLIVWVARLDILGLRLSRFTADFHRADGRIQRARATRRGYELRPAFRGPLRGERATTLRWSAPELSADLVYEPRHEPWEPERPLFRAGGKGLWWRVEVPDADVGGELRWSGGAAVISARGYVDRVRTDIPPWRLPIRELSWGRAAAGSHARVWLRAETMDGTLTSEWRDGVPAPPGDARPDPGEGRLISAGSVADLESLRLGALRPLLRRLAGDPYRERRIAPTVIGGESGWAVHETVRWR